MIPLGTGARPAHLLSRSRLRTAGLYPELTERVVSATGAVSAPSAAGPDTKPGPSKYELEGPGLPHLA
jgi:hypothetical protein